jgi:hypothetical protein
MAERQTTTTSAHDFAKNNMDEEAFRSPTSAGTWSSTANEEDNGPLTSVSSRPPLKSSRSMPELGRSTTQRSMSSVLGYEKVSWDLETSPNGVAPSNIGGIVEMVRSTGHPLPQSWVE